MTDERRSLTLRLPFPPSANTHWRNISKGPLAGRVLISERGRDYRRVVLQLCMEADAMHGLAGRLLVLIEAYPPDRRARDLDNLQKPLLDSLTKANVWRDDSQIDDLHIVRRSVVAGGAIVVHIETIVAGHVSEQQPLALSA